MECCLKKIMYISRIYYSMHKIGNIRQNSLLKPRPRWLCWPHVHYFHKPRRDSIWRLADDIGVDILEFSSKF